VRSNTGGPEGSPLPPSRWRPGGGILNPGVVISNNTLICKRK
jgi:hypothetical protein